MNLFTFEILIYLRIKFMRVYTSRALNKNNYSSHTQTSLRQTILPCVSIIGKDCSEVRVHKIIRIQGHHLLMSSLIYETGSSLSIRGGHSLGLEGLNL